jgi:peptide/nickel transport system permease protein
MSKWWPSAVLGFWLLAAMLGMALDANQIDLAHILQKPSLHHLFGCDDLGRDIARRMWAGAQVSLTVAFTVSVVAMLLGASIGLLAGFYGAALDRALMGITDVFLAFPGILLAIAFAAVLGAGLGNMLIALSLTAWVSYARLTRAQALSLRHSQHVQASRCLGASDTRLMLKHILPLLLAPLLVELSYGMASLIIAEASLSFLGLGIQAPQASWGGMLKDAVRYLLVAPHYVCIVGLGLMSLVLAINVLGDQLRDYLDVKSSRP